jgi:putative endonuclease
MRIRAFLFMPFSVYILWSDELNKFYVGSTNDLQDRLNRHNSGYERFTSKGLPWRLVHFIECNDRKEAYNLEMKIKARGIRRYLEDHQINF